MYLRYPSSIEKQLVSSIYSLVKKNMKKILVADDDISILEAIKIVLEDEGYSVYITPNGESVLKIQPEEYPDLILLDIWMSGIDGAEICRKIKENDRTGKIPVIMISASIEIENITKECGADDFIMKPFEIDELIMKINKCLKSDL